MHALTEHQQRVKNELSEAGVTRYGLMKLESRHLPGIILPDEHIDAVAYGLAKRYSAMLVATDRRIIYLDRKPFYTISDEVTYDMVAGVGFNEQKPYASITLHTRIGDYSLRFVRLEPARRFVKYIGLRQLEHPVQPSPIPPTAPKAAKPAPTMVFPSLDETGAAFLHKKHLGTLSSVDREGNVSGAVVYYFVDADHDIYILTKSDTHKAHNILANPQVALTVYDAKLRQTLQLHGMAEVVTNQDIKDFIFQQMTQPRTYEDRFDLPPVTKLKSGAYVVICITPTTAHFHDFSKE